MPNIPVQNGQLPQGFCPPDYQSILNAFSNAQFVSIAGVSSGFVVSASPPADHTVAWLQLDSLGRPTRVYFFAQGAWLSLHPQVPGQTVIWINPLPNFTTFDGGDASAAPFSATSGQMWQLAASSLDGTGSQVMAARMPLVAGTLTSGLVVNVNDIGGEEKHILSTVEMPPHAHPEQIAINRAVANGGSTDTSGNGGFVGPIGLGGTELISKTTGGDPNTGNPPAQAAAHNNMSLYYGVYVLQRTSRLFYVVNP